MSKHLTLSITKVGEVKKIVRALESEKYSINRKAERFIYRLADIGIASAKANTGSYGAYILFTKEVKFSEIGVECLLVATDGVKLIKEWYTDKELTNKRSYEISPLLMAEFGSGWFATVQNWYLSGVGQGTMPNSYGHAFNPDGWYWYDVAGVKHHSKGEKPTYPMHAAMVAMMMEVESTAREVFKV